MFIQKLIHLGHVSLPFTTPSGGEWQEQGLQGNMLQSLRAFKLTKILCEWSYAQTVLRLHLCSRTGTGGVNCKLFAAWLDLLLGFYNKKFCCYYCSAMQWINDDDDDHGGHDSLGYLYTCFGPHAWHRATLLDCAAICKNSLRVSIGYVQFGLNKTEAHPG